jgi:UDP-glucose 6-dehydrogenase
MDMKIAVAGTGYVGLSIATLLAQHNKVYAVDIIAEKVEKINNRISPIQDEYIEKYLKQSHYSNGNTFSCIYKGIVNHKFSDDLYNNKTVETYC